ncbi:MAG: glycogen/starch synthase, partial [Candidatus Altarchaeaceae archaeon]
MKEVNVLALSFEYPPAQVGGLGTAIKNIYKEIWKYSDKEKVYVSLAIPSNGLQNGFKNIYIEKFETSFYVSLSNRQEKVDVLLARDKENPLLPIHLICSNTLNNWKIYDNIHEKIAIFSRAIPMFLDHLYWNGFNINIIHSHDWHTGIAGAISKLKYKNLKFIFTIHRIAAEEAKYETNFLDYIKFYEFDDISKASYFSGYGYGKFSIEALSANYA